jgi:hypothetical protein
MTRKDYIVIAQALAELYKDEIEECQSTLHTSKAEEVISKHLNQNYSNFNISKFGDYITKKAGI